jgi:hypothetical protein
MTTSHDRGSAEIYQFPPRGRFVVAGRRDESEPAGGIALSRLTTTAFSGSWYHEEAIQEAERARKI